MEFYEIYIDCANCRRRNTMSFEYGMVVPEMHPWKCGTCGVKNVRVDSACNVIEKEAIYAHGYSPKEE